MDSDLTKRGLTAMALGQVRMAGIWEVKSGSCSSARKPWLPKPWRHLLDQAHGGIQRNG